MQQSFFEFLEFENGKRRGAGRPNGPGKFGEDTKPIRVPISDLERAIQCVQNRFYKLLLYYCPVRAGRPSSVESDVDKETDLIDLLIKKPNETFFVKVAGASMIKFRLEDKTKLVIRPSGREPKIKLYLEVMGKTNENVLEAIEKCDEKLKNLSSEFVKLTEEIKTKFTT